MYSAPSSCPLTPTSIARSRSAHQSIAEITSSGPQVFVVTDEAASRPSRTGWTNRASGNMRRSVCASLMLCELISTSRGLPAPSAQGPRRSQKSPRQAPTGSSR